DLLRIEAARALEEEVLDEVGDARAVGALVTGSDVDPEAERDGAHARHPLGDDPLAGVELAQDDLLHCSAPAPAKPAPPLLSVLRRAYARVDRRRTAARGVATRARRSAARCRSASRRTGPRRRGGTASAGRPRPRDTPRTRSSR